MTGSRSCRHAPRRRRASALAGITVLALALAAVPATAQVKIPPDFTFTGGKDSPGPVTFSHTGHKEKNKVEKCQACHPKIFKLKRGATGALSMQEMKAGDQCGACHNGRTEIAGKVVFTVDDRANCERCHKK